MNLALVLGNRGALLGLPLVQSRLSRQRGRNRRRNPVANVEAMTVQALEAVARRAKCRSALRARQQSEQSILDGACSLPRGKHAAEPGRGASPASTSRATARGWCSRSTNARQARPMSPSRSGLEDQLAKHVGRATPASLAQSEADHRTGCRSHRCNSPPAAKSAITSTARPPYHPIRSWSTTMSAACEALQHLAPGSGSREDQAEQMTLRAQQVDRADHVLRSPSGRGSSAHGRSRSHHRAPSQSRLEFSGSALASGRKAHPKGPAEIRVEVGERAVRVAQEARSRRLSIRSRADALRLPAPAVRKRARIASLVGHEQVCRGAGAAGARRRPAELPDLQQRVAEFEVEDVVARQGMGQEARWSRHPEVDRYRECRVQVDVVVVAPALGAEDHDIALQPEFALRAGGLGLAPDIKRRVKIPGQTHRPAAGDSGPARRSPPRAAPGLP